MKVLSIDIGTYSVKFLETIIERKNLVFIKKHCEILSDDTEEDILSSVRLTDLQLRAVKNYLEESEFQGKIIFTVQSKFLTSRILELPTTSKKKIDMMIPFQLDRELPFPAAEALYGYQLINVKKTTHSVLSAIELSKFDIYYKNLEYYKILPDILTSELAVVQSYIDTKKMDDSVVIIDIGHETTKAYFSENRKITSTHISYIAGKIINENIAENYQISLEEANKFKIGHSFFLTNKQIEEADEEQKEFAQLMKKIFSPLVNDIKKWMLSFRVNQGSKISNIYLSGGSSNVKNICNFFAQELEVNTTLLKVDFESSEFSNEESVDFFMANLISQSFCSKLPIMNFRKGQYAAANIENIPLHSGTFILLRVGIISIFLMLFLAVESFLILRKEKMLLPKVQKIIKNSNLNISRKIQRFVSSKPSLIVDKLKKQNEKVNKDFQALKQALSRKNEAFLFSKVLSDLVPNEKWEIFRYDASEDETTIIFKFNDDEGKTNLIEQLNHLSPRDYISANIDENQKEKILTFSFKGV